MGTWASRYFENDGAGDALEELGATPGPRVARMLRLRALYVDVDDGQRAWLACELVAIAAGHGENAPAGIVAVARKLAPSAVLRSAALAAVARIADRTSSELAQLSAEDDDSTFPASMADLRKRLRSRPRKLAPAPKLGDLVALPGCVMQVLGDSEVAVFVGRNAAPRTAPAIRVPTRVHARLAPIGRRPVRADLAGKKRYALTSGSSDTFFTVNASGRSMAIATYDDVRALDLHELYDAAMLREVARGERLPGHPPSPEAQRAEQRAAWRQQGARRRRVTTPGPFGDPEVVAELLTWIDQCGMDNAYEGLYDQACGRSGYGRPNEHDERWAYARIGMVALWLGTWPKRDWPKHLTLPPKPSARTTKLAIAASRKLIGDVLHPDGALSLIWGDELGPIVKKLTAALA